jgi:hypothetical protein
MEPVMTTSQIASNTRPQAASKPQSTPFPRLYRAFIGAPSYGIERTAFVEAASHRDAIRRIANAVAALETKLPEVIEERLYNVASAQELMDEGMSPDLELRLFETGWSDGKAICFVEEPLFLVASPAALIRKWATLSAEVST